MKMFSFPPPFPLRRFCNYSPDALRPPGALCRVQKRLRFWPLSIFAPFRQIQPCPVFDIHISFVLCYPYITILHIFTDRLTVLKSCLSRQNLGEADKVTAFSNV